MLYDNYPGGIGQSDPLFRRRAELLAEPLSIWLRAAAANPVARVASARHNEIGSRGKEGADQSTYGKTAWLRLS